jgi:hypothetical protein
MFWHYKQWREDGVIEQILETLYGHLREQVKKKEPGQR